MRKRFFFKAHGVIKTQKIEEVIKKNVPNRIIKVTDNPDKSQTISIL